MGIENQEMIEKLKADQFLIWHLRYNHFPPISTDFVESAKQAVNNVLQEEYDTEIILPNGKVLKSGEIVEELHLWEFVESQRYSYDGNL